MLFHYFPKNETPPLSYPPQYHTLRPSASSDSIFTNRKPYPFKRPFFPDLPFIYENIKINKTPSINHLKREILSLSRQARFERLQKINSMHKLTLRNALFQTKTPYNTLLITASYDRSNTYTKHNKMHFNLNSSSIQDTTNCFNNSIDIEWIGLK